ncbi:hypothetical protein ACIOK4_39490 [Streptomyces bottropensis]|uniref:hypothetical protein n=1 Tax=Streptomyces bottropensis TaxID=42235 RepID=UPI0037FD72B7
MGMPQTPEEITAAIQAGMTGRIYEEQQAQQSPDVAVVDGDVHGISGGTHHGDLYFDF